MNNSSVVRKIKKVNFDLCPLNTDVKFDYSNTRVVDDYCKWRHAIHGFPYLHRDQGKGVCTFQEQLKDNEKTKSFNMFSASCRYAFYEYSFEDIYLITKEKCACEYMFTFSNEQDETGFTIEISGGVDHFKQKENINCTTKFTCLCEIESCRFHPVDGPLSVDICNDFIKKIHYLICNQPLSKNKSKTAKCRFLNMEMPLKHINTKCKKKYAVSPAVYAPSFPALPADVTDKEVSAPSAPAPSVPASPTDVTDKEVSAPSVPALPTDVNEKNITDVSKTGCLSPTSKKILYSGIAVSALALLIASIIFIPVRYIVVKCIKNINVFSCERCYIMRACSCLNILTIVSLDPEADPLKEN